MKPLTNQPVRFLIERFLSQEKQLWFLKMWFLISGFLLYTVTGKIIEIKTENAAEKCRGEGNTPVKQLRESCSGVVTKL